MTESSSYEVRRSQIEVYFDRTAAEAWKRLTSTAPLGRIRASVRRGRDEMRAHLLAFLPADLAGRRVLDAGCGTGALSLELARRGAEVVAVDLAPSLIDHARAFCAARPVRGGGSIRFIAGDMTDPGLGRFDHVVAMDSLLHYEPADVFAALSALASRTTGSLLVTLAPRTPVLVAMHRIGRLLPKDDRAPAIVPVEMRRIREGVSRIVPAGHWRIGRTVEVRTGFYKSRAVEVLPA